MSFTDEDFDKAKAAGVSDTQLYKQAGNSIVVHVLYYIFQELYNAMPYLFEDLKVSSFFSGIGAFEKALDILYENLDSTEESGGDRKIAA
jgi:DNA (cytosine-5)-methyltransferase 1